MDFCITFIFMLEITSLYHVHVLFHIPMYCMFMIYVDVVCVFIMVMLMVLFCECYGHFNSIYCVFIMVILMVLLCYDYGLVNSYGLHGLWHRLL